MADTSKELRQVLKQRQDSVTDCTKVAKDLNPNIKNALNAREATVSNEFSLNFTKVQYEGAKQLPDPASNEIKRYLVGMLLAWLEIFAAPLEVDVWQYGIAMVKPEMAKWNDERQAGEAALAAQAAQGGGSQ